MLNDYSSEQEETLRTFVKMIRASESILGYVNCRISSEGLTPSQFGVLEALLHHGSLTHKELSEKILRSSGNITLVIDNLEKRELVSRNTDPKDRRKILVSLNHKGDELIRRVIPARFERIYTVFSILNYDEIIFLSSLSKKLGLHASELNRQMAKT